MIENFKKYSEYKDSGVEWIGEIPEHWELLKVKNAFKLIAEPAPKNNNEELLSIYTKIGVRPRKDLEAKGNKASTTDNYWIVRKGDLIVNKLLAWMGAIGISDYDGVTSPAYDILRGNANVNPKFYNYLFRNKTIRHELKRRSKGIMDMRLRLYFDEFGQILIPIPPKEEQTKIANFLNDKTTQIDNYIARKEKTIALLEERKAAIINQAVTKGLNPNAEMKSSGVEWLGDIPKHWEVKKIKRLLLSIDYGTSEVSKVDGTIPILTMGNIQKGEVTEAGKGGLYKVADYLLLKKNDLLYTRTNGNPELVGKVGIYRKNNNSPITYASYLVRFRADKYTDAEWLHLLLNSSLFWSFARSQALVNLQTNLNSTKYSQFKVPVPNLEEQKMIKKYVYEKYKQINSSIRTAKKQIKLIKEYRQSLISAAVTGKIDVREAA